MPPKIPNIKLNNGREVPILGLGTWKSKPGEVTMAVKDAIDSGYRHIDCAPVYENEREVGQGIKAKIDQGVVKRDNLFITSKLWCNSHSKQAVVPALKKTLLDLRLDYLDLYLMHGPVGVQEGGVEYTPKNADGSAIASDVDFIETWKAMEEVVGLGLAKSIGVSNFNHEQLERLLKEAKIPPVTNQIEVSPYLTNVKLVDFCQSKGISVTGYSCFGSSPVPQDKIDNSQPAILEDKLLKEMAATHKKSVAQVILRWAIQRNIIVIPKSVTKKRIQENIDVFNFTLSSKEVEKINGLNRNIRVVPWLWAKTHKYYPFNAEY